MMRWKNWLVAAAAAAALVACGGGDPYVPGSAGPSGAPTSRGSFTALVSFGDSLSDIGTYAPATSLTGNGQPPFFGGKFTTNSATGTVWVENLAATLGLIVTPAEVGFAGQSQPCPAAANPALANTCTGYGQGGARVTDPNGIGKSGGALTVPVKTQIANHLARFASFKASDLIFVYAGSNDVFVQFGGFAASAAQIQADAAAGRITPDQANNLLLNAQLTAQAGMKQAALELATYVNDQILAKGGVYVVIVGLSDIADTPFGNSPTVVPARSVLSGLSEIFNLWLREGLKDRPVQWIDTWSLYKTAYQNPAQFGFANNTVPACDATLIAQITANQVIDGSSLFCNSTTGAPFYGLRAGASDTTWQFADSVHPTKGGHKVISDTFAAQLRGFGWIQ